MEMLGWLGWVRHSCRRRRRRCGGRGRGSMACWRSCFGITDGGVRRVWREVRDMRGVRDMREMVLREMRDMRGMREMRDMRGMREVKDMRGVREMREIVVMRDMITMRGMREAIKTMRCISTMMSQMASITHSPTVKTEPTIIPTPPSPHGDTHLS